MLFSEIFHIQIPEQYDWFDPILHTDVKLFIDPLLIKKSRIKEFSNSSKTINDFFQEIFQLVIQSSGAPNSEYYKLALSSLRFPEVPELCLGFSEKGVEGRGSGTHFSKKIFTAIRDYIGFGIVYDKFSIDVLNIFVEDMAKDRISDLTADIIKLDLIRYTQNICNQLRVPLERLPVENYYYDKKSNSWVGGYHNLPKNPYTGKPIILVPKEFLVRDPLVNEHRFVNYLLAGESQNVRHRLTSEITGQLDKNKIKEYISKNPRFLINFLKRIEADPNAIPYDLSEDKFFEYRWYIDARNSSNLLIPHLTGKIETETDLMNFVTNLCYKFKFLVEERGVYRCFWASGRPAPESIVHKIFETTIFMICEHYDVDVSAEPNAGRGPADYKFSKGCSLKAILEIKLARSDRAIEGLTVQLNQYMKSEQTRNGFYLVLAYKKQEIERIKELIELGNKIRQRNNKNIHVLGVDATPNKLSASKLP